LIASVVFGLVFALSAGLLMLALSSLSRNSRYVALFWLGLWIVSGGVATVLTIVDREEQEHQVIRELGGWQAMRGNRSTRQAYQEKLLERVQQSAKTNWRPLISYRANMDRLADELIGKNASIEKIATLQRPRDRAEFVTNFMANQYPWQWSAAVLAVLCVVSASILSFSVKSLDRLK
jgi:ABC-2 type transport system permease protein